MLLLHRYRTALSDRHKNVTWPDFVDAVLGKDGYDKIHWTPQSHFCGMRRYHSLLNFVGNFELLRAHGELLISQAGLQNESEFSTTHTLEQTNISFTDAILCTSIIIVCVFFSHIYFCVCCSISLPGMGKSCFHQVPNPSRYHTGLAQAAVCIAVASILCAERNRRWYVAQKSGAAQGEVKLLCFVCGINVIMCLRACC